MNVLIVSGIWPPDVGGPASHAPELAEFLGSRGHGVEIVITADREPAPEPYRVHTVSRRLPRGVRHAATAAFVARAARRADVVYATGGMIVRTSLGAALARKPLVLKLTSDPIYERALRYSLTDADVDAFQRDTGLVVRALRVTRDIAVRRAARLVVPSDALRRLALGWGVAEERIVLLPNPIAAPDDLPDREELRAVHGVAGPTLVFAGRLAPQKRMDVALDAIAATEGVTLLIAGDGPIEDALRRRAGELGLDGRVRFLGAQPRRKVFELLRAADAAVLPSSWENFPHMLVEALAVGTPVVATAVGGVTEIVRDGENGLLVPPGDADALGDAVRKLLGDATLRDQLSSRAAASVERFNPDLIYGELERVLGEAAA